MLKAAIISMTISLFFAVVLSSIGVNSEQIPVLCLIMYYGSFLTLKDVVE